ncbi:MAG: TRAP transporter [Desulfitibacter sp. BRH_c19]|nr:MAG: TRAP transporter [Desulfitibacter sp. BRH_c19]
MVSSEGKEIFKNIEIGPKTTVDHIKEEGIIQQGFFKLTFLLLALGLGIFSLYTGFFGLLETWQYRMIHLISILALVIVGDLVFLKRDSFLKRESIKNGFLQFLAVAMLTLLVGLTIYSYVQYENIIYRAGMPNFYDKVFGTFLIILVIYAGARRLGWVITGIVGIFIAYALFGNYLPGDLYHRGLSYDRFIDFMYNQTTGVLGVPIKVAAEYVIMFILFGGFLNKSGAGEFFIRLAFAMTGKLWGGPAKAAIVASALMGTINGSGVANAVATGSITIPLMKRVGYKPHFAAAVEAAASNGGMIMPPIMASVAFLIAEFTGTPYSKIMLYGLFPAALYFFAVMLMVHFEAKKTNLKPLEAAMIPNLWETFKKGWYFLLPIVVLVALLIKGFSPMRAATVGMGMMVILSYMRKETRMGIYEILSAIEEGIRNTIVVSVACAMAGIVVGVITSTGLGIKFSSIVLSLAGGNLFLALILTMISSIILGMGMTAAAVYVIVSALTVQALIDMGVLLMPAHFFVYYYGISSAITPPVALAAYGAAGIAGANQNLTALVACKLAVVTFLIPFAFIYNPAIMAIGTVSEVVLAVATASVGVVALSAGLSRWLLDKLQLWQQFILVAAGIGLFTHIYWANAAGIVVLSIIYVLQIRNRKKQKVLLCTLNKEL